MVCFLQLFCPSPPLNFAPILGLWFCLFLPFWLCPILVTKIMCHSLGQKNNLMPTQCYLGHPTCISHIICWKQNTFFLPKPAPTLFFPSSVNSTSTLPVAQARNLEVILNLSSPHPYVPSTRKSRPLHLQNTSRINYFSHLHGHPGLTLHFLLPGLLLSSPPSSPASFGPWIHSPQAARGNLLKCKVKVTVQFFIRTAQ